MAKRFTDTEKWKDPWFKKLKSKYQLFWMFVLDTCDHAGIWKDQVDDFEYFTGLKITHSEIIKVFQDRMICINIESYFVSKFISFQYGQLNPERNNAHKGVMKSLAYAGISYPIGGASEGLVRGYLGAQDKEQEKDKDQDKDLDKEKEKALSKKILPEVKTKAKRKTKPKEETSPLAFLYKPDDEIQTWLCAKGASFNVQRELLETYSHHILKDEVKTAYQWQLEREPRNAGLYLKTWLKNSNKQVYGASSEEEDDRRAREFFKSKFGHYPDEVEAVYAAEQGSAG